MGYDRCCIKFPVDVPFMSKILKWYPDSKIVHITRDPRAIAVSRINYAGGNAQKNIAKYPKLEFFIKKIMMTFVILEYTIASGIHQKYKNYSLYKYEDLLVSPRQTINNLCQFVELDFTDEMLFPKKGQPSSITGGFSSGFNTKAGTNWKRIITPFENTFITHFTKGSMKRFAYCPQTHPLFKLR